MSATSPPLLYPNPFNPSTEIRFQVPAAVHVRLSVYDVLGQEVAVLVDEVKQAGTYAVQFNGARLASGTYFYKLQAGNYVATKKLLWLKQDCTPLLREKPGRGFRPGFCMH